MAKATDCPCTSGLPYRACCAPFHKGEREAETPEALMRSRFAGFARKDIDYLVRTLHPKHEDRKLSDEELRRSMMEWACAFRYMGLKVLERRDADADGVAGVLFLARIFEKGRERSFVELSDFAHDGVGWRYLRGITIPIDQIPGDPEKLTLATFRALAAQLAANAASAATNPE
jgi:SEC-C motif-containing protein